MKLKRVNGFDIAVALLVPLALYYVFHLGIGQNKNTFRRDQFNLLFDGAVAAFIFLNGLTIGLSMGSGDSLRGLQKYLVIRAVVFAGLGLLIDLTGMPHFFVALGLLSAAASVLVALSSFLLRVITVVMLTTAFYVYFLTDTHISLNAIENGSIPHFLAHHLVHGYYALLSWAPFFLGGLLFSRRMFDRHFKPGWPGVATSMLLVVFGIGFELMLNARFPNLGGIDASPYPFMQPLQFLYPSFMLTAFGLCMSVGNIAAMTNDRSSLRLFTFLGNYGKLKYSVILAALTAGWMASLLLAGNENFGYRTVAIFTFLVWGITFVGATVWLRFFSNGPVEMLLRAISPGK